MVLSSYFERKKKHNDYKFCNKNEDLFTKLVIFDERRWIKHFLKDYTDFVVGS